MCNEKHIHYKELSKEHLTTLDRVCRLDLIDEIIGYGALCMQLRPCTHSLKYLCIDGKTYNIKYACYRFIRELYLKLYNNIDAIPFYIFIKKNKIFPQCELACVKNVII